MSLTAGSRVGPYEVVALIGEGGMGQVYRGRDTKLSREVALKTLPATFATDPERLARFQREAQVLASLNHPNIGHIYALEEACLVLELVPGPTLADRIARGPISLAEALPIARQIAEALECAHAQGIIHRDLKPANVKVRDDGTVKVLDFGLAKALDPVGSASGELMNSPTITSPAMTERGIILGTAAYMSPEQARGKAVDKRADIWAFGCVLYEMLTGAQTFGGETLTDVLASVVKNEPDLNALPPDTPKLVRSVLRRCLQKDPSKRLHDIADARLELNEAMTEPEETAAVAAGQPKGASSGPRWLVAVAALALGLAIGAAAFWALRPRDEKPVIKLAVTRPDGGPMGTSAQNTEVAVSPDGEYIVYTINGQTGNQLQIRGLRALDTTVVPGVTNGISPFISPDGKWVGFFEQSTLTLKKASIAGGSPVAICPYIGAPRGASWSPDDRIVFATGDAATGLLRVPAAGGTPEVLTTPERTKDEQDHFFPEVLPDGGAVLYTSVASGNTGARVALLDLASGASRILTTGSHPRFVSPGYIAFGVENTLRVAAFDSASRQLKGNPIPVVERVMRKPSQAMSFAVSTTGTLAYHSGDASVSLRTLAWIDRQGKVEDIPAPKRNYVYPRVSPDGTRLALDVRDQENDTWVWDFGRKTLSRLTIDAGLNRGAAWAPDGLRIAFSAVRGGNENVYWQAADGSGVAEPLTTGPGVQVPSAFSSDGKYLLFMEPSAAPFDISMVDVTAPADARHSSKLLNGSYNEGNGEVSPDGRWIAYESNESGQRNEIYVRPFPNVNAGGRWQVSTTGGTRAVWLPKSGRELFYYEPSPPDAPATTTARIMAVPIRPGPTFLHDNAEVAVAAAPAPAGLQGRHYDVSPDGRRFLVIKPADTDQKPPQLIVVLNWVEELKRLVTK